MGRAGRRAAGQLQRRACQHTARPPARWSQEPRRLDTRRSTPRVGAVLPATPRSGRGCGRRRGPRRSTRMCSAICRSAALGPRDHLAGHARRRTGRRLAAMLSAEAKTAALWRADSPSTPAPPPLCRGCLDGRGAARSVAGDAHVVLPKDFIIAQLTAARWPPTRSGAVGVSLAPICAMCRCDHRSRAARPRVSCLAARPTRSTSSAASPSGPFVGVPPLAMGGTMRRPGPACSALGRRLEGGRRCISLAPARCWA